VDRIPFIIAAFMTMLTIDIAGACCCSLLKRIGRVWAYGPCHVVPVSQPASQLAFESFDVTFDQRPFANQSSVEDSCSLLVRLTLDASTSESNQRARARAHALTTAMFIFDTLCYSTRFSELLPFYE